MGIKIALAGNPNCGKTTLFNALTGANQFVGNWPGVTVEKKEGKLKRHDDVIITDLPGIYSLSPYTLEEVVARNYLIHERPDAILNIVDGTNLERNLYLSTQLAELGIPTVIAINMMDVVKKNGDRIDTAQLSRELGCEIVEISALKNTGIQEAAEVAIEAAKRGKPVPMHTFSGSVEHAIAHIEEAAVHGLPEEQQRWYAIKIFERDEKVLSELKLDLEKLSHIEKDIKRTEDEFEDDAESIITNERYIYIAQLMKHCYKKKQGNKMTTSDKIDRVVTNRWAALPIFALIMFLVYFISVTTVGTWVTDFTNDGLFGDGWHLFGISTNKDGVSYDDALDEHGNQIWEIPELKEKLEAAAYDEVPGAGEILGAYEDRDFGAFEEAYGSYGAALVPEDENDTEYYISAATDELINVIFVDAPDPADYGIWVMGLGELARSGLQSVGCWEWLESLLVDGIIGGVGAVLGFVPQMFVLFLLLAFLEACGYMARVAFVMDRIFRRIGLSGKSFISMVIGIGCSVPGIMAARTIENERDRRMTVITTSFMPCGAKLPVIALVAGACFGGAWWVAPSAYFIGIAAVVVSGVILKKTKRFAGEPAPFVMELPAYHMPAFSNLMRSMWERGWSFVKKAGTIILLASVIIWAGSSFGFNSEGVFGFGTDIEIQKSIIGYIGLGLGWLFTPLGFGAVGSEMSIAATVATIMGLVAKEEIVGVFGVLEFMGMGGLAGYSFLLFNLLCAPCFAAMGAIKREMNNTRWTLFAIGYQCLLAYAVSFSVYNIGALFIGAFNWWEPITFALALCVIAFAVYMLVRPYKDSTDMKIKNF